MLSAAFTRTPDHAVLSVRHGDTSLAAVIAARLLAEDSPVARQAEAVADALSGLPGRIDGLAARFQPDALVAELDPIMDKDVIPAVSDFMTVLRREAEAVEAAERLGREPVPGDPQLAGEYRARWAALPAPEKHRAVEAMTVEETSALIAAGEGAFPGLLADTWPALIEHHQIVAHVARTGLQAHHQVAPSLDRPLAVGPDREAAMRAARQVLAVHHARRDLLDAGQTAIRSIVGAVATLIGEPADAVFSRVVSAGR